MIWGGLYPQAVTQDDRKPAAPAARGSGVTSREFVRACVPAAVISTNNVFRLQMQAPPRGCRSSRLLLVVMEEGIGHQAPQQVTNLAVNCDHVLKFVLVSNRSSYVCTIGTGCLICMFRMLGTLWC